MKELREVHVPACPMAGKVGENGQVDELLSRKISQPEPVPGIDLQEKTSVAGLLAKVKDIVSGQPQLLEREFLPVVSNGAVLNGAGESGSLRVMQWNILADALSIGKDNFVRCPTAALEWSTRRLYILQEILSVDPDVLTLQEVDHFGFFKHLLATCGYEGFFFPKPDSPTLYVPNNNGPDGCAVFYRSNKVELIKDERIVLKTLPGMQDTNQVSIIVHLRLKDSGKEVAVATTHLKAKNGWERLRHLQGAYLANYLEEAVPDKPLILCGDFNAENTEPVYSVFSKSALGLNSAYQEAGGKGIEPDYTSWKIRGSSDGKTEKESKRTIDYIWYSREKSTLHSVFSLPTPEQIGENRLPSHTYPSDHLSLAADFVLN